MIHQRQLTVACRLAAAAVAAVLLQPVAQAQTPAKPASATMAGMGMSSTMPAGKMDMKAMMKDMNDKMSTMQMTGKTDVDFAMMMRIHHQGAIHMAEAELKDGKEPQMKKMAKDIISAQKKEIAQIDKFLAKQGHSMDKMKN
ncbi:MAG: DUF305 domain-containing protein [Ramlibacter sp.]